MTKFKQFITGAAVAMLLLTGAAATASAATQYVGGGIWEYGVGGGKVHSDYYHDSLRHGSSVNGKSGLVQSPCTAQGTWSRASDDSKTWGGNTAYWRHC